MRSLIARVRRRVSSFLSPGPRPAPGPAAPPAPRRPDQNDPPDWPRLLEKDWDRWREAVQAAEGGPRVLIATSTGGFQPAVTLESLLAVALTLRGARPHFLLCDEALPACQHAMAALIPDLAGFAAQGPAPYLCPKCFASGERTYAALGLPVHHLRDWLEPHAASQAGALSASIPLAEVQGFAWEGLGLGEQALAGALRFFARGDLDGEPQAEAILRRYLNASLLTAAALRRLVEAQAFSKACLHHGIYVPQGVIAEVLRQKGVPVVTWDPAYRKQRFVFSHDRSYHRALIDEPAAHWENLPWSDTLATATMDYLKSRWQGARDWIWFHEKAEEDLSAIEQMLGIDFSRPTIGLLTNVMWDAQLLYPANAFPSLLDWVLRTIRYFAGRPELQLVIRIHPAEVRGTVPSRQPLLAEIHKAFPELPGNVFIIPPESPINTYVVMLRCSAALIYATTTGVELTSMGIPVIVAGEAWIRGKGITQDARSPEEYFRLLDGLPLASALPPAQVERARKYAFHFYFRRMIPLKMIEPVSGPWFYRLKPLSLDDLRPGRSAGLDVVCDGILHGTEFIYPAEQYLGDLAD